MGRRPVAPGADLRRPPAAVGAGARVCDLPYRRGRAAPAGVAAPGGGLGRPHRAGPAGRRRRGRAGAGGPWPAAARPGGRAAPGPHRRQSPAHGGAAGRPTVRRGGGPRPAARCPARTPSWSPRPWTPVPPAARDLARALAVLGHSAPLPLVAEVARVGSPESRPACAGSGPWPSASPAGLGPGAPLAQITAIAALDSRLDDGRLVGAVSQVAGVDDRGPAAVASIARVGGRTRSPGASPARSARSAGGARGRVLRWRRLRPLPAGGSSPSPTPGPGARSPSRTVSCGPPSPPG